MMFKMVDLPQPEWPITQANSPFSTPKVTFSKTVSSCELLRSPNRLLRFSTYKNGLVLTRRDLSRIMVGEIQIPSYSTASLARAKIQSKNMPTKPIIKMEKITAARSRLFHSFQT